MSAELMGRGGALPLRRNSIHYIAQATSSQTGKAGNPAAPARTFAGTARPDAAPHAAAALEGAREAFPAGHWFLGLFLDTHGNALLAMSDYASAEKALLESYQVLAASLGADSGETTDTIKSLVKLYEAWDKPAEAADWRAKLADAEPGE